jgi:ribosome-associated translation inhibitor RaiA
MERRFIFKNFVPSSSTHSYCSRKFCQVWGYAPSDSDINAQVVKTAAKKYHTRIEINAANGKFVGEANDEAILVSIGLAVDSVHDSLMLWKKSRFAPRLE